VSNLTGLFHRRDAQVFADLARKLIDDLVMTGTEERLFWRGLCHHE
jgi:hypothetical protein